MTTYLNVPFRDKAEAKAKGARWDSEARKWFVPIGRELEPFASWLPVDPAKLASQEVAEAGKGVPLSQLLAGVATAVEQAFRQGVWTTAEVVRVDGDTHVYLELAERDTSGKLIAKARAIVWSRDTERVLGTFQAATGVRLAAGIKVLIRAKPEFSAQYGLTLHVDAIDPSYTLGDLEAKKRHIRERLKADGVFDRNRQLPTPWDYRALLVVSPPRAAGLGDFAREADRLQRHRLCDAVYAHSRFEGEGAPDSIRETIEAALAAWPGLIAAVPVPDPAYRRNRVEIKGELAKPINPPAGCRFAPRCPLAMPQCATTPKMVGVSQGHSVACHGVAAGLSPALA